MSAAKSDPYLYKIYCRLNKKYFNNEVLATITWDSSPNTHEQQWGCYCPDDKNIEISLDFHPSPPKNPRFLKRKRPPQYFLEYIIFHEMLHQLVDSVVYSNGVTNHHPPAFLEREKEFTSYEKAKEWERSAGCAYGWSIIPFGSVPYKERLEKAGVPIQFHTQRSFEHWGRCPTLGEEGEVVFSDWNWTWQKWKILGVALNKKQFVVGQDTNGNVNRFAKELVFPLQESTVAPIESTGHCILLPRTSSQLISHNT